MYDLEKATAHPAAADDARKNAVATFLAYRRAGGENQSGPSPELCKAVAQAIRGHNFAFADRELAQLAASPHVPDYRRPLIPKLQAVLRGSRDFALADDPGLEYDDAVELRLLLEDLQTGPP